MSKKQEKKTTVLLILDGWGIAPKSPANAIEQAKKPNFDAIMKKYPKTQLQASGKFVGLPEAQSGNSEAGHENIGAGRLVNQDSVFISKEIATGRFFKNAAFTAAKKHLKRNNSNLHIMGMVSDGGSAHSDPDHLWALITWARKENIKDVYLHLFTDGRDSPPHASLKLVEAIMRGLRNKESGNSRTGEWIATITGRYYGMDRKKHWQNTEMTYNCLVRGESDNYARSPQEAITQSYNRGETDEFIPPYVIKRGGRPIATIKDGDAVMFFNLRSDRARQLAKPFVQKDFNKMNPGSFKRKKVLKNLAFVAMTDFGPDLDSILTAYPSTDLLGTLPMALDGYKQIYIAETEKYAHMTYFFNGGYSDPIAGEERFVVPSPDVSSYDKKPEMSVYEITKKVLDCIGKYDFIAINFANTDMIGHTGNIKACIEAVQHVDKCLGEIKSAVLAKKGTLVVTSDHGNADVMLDLKTGEMYTEHTSNPVPLAIVESTPGKYKMNKGKLGDITPTVLKLMNIEQPKEMSGKALF